MSVVAIIPARYGSTRLPGKPLLAETGKPLIRHVVEAVRAAGGIDRIVVATDDARIARAVADFGGETVMTRPDHACGTDRIAEAAEKLKLRDDDVVINVQGDEPEMPVDCIESLVDLIQSGGAPMATLAAPLPAQEADETNKVKVVCSRSGRALYFSRAKIPHDRDGTAKTDYLLHLGVYAYRVGFLKRFARLPPTPAETSEKLEQLRALEHGCEIAVAVVNYDGRGIDTPEDYAAFVSKTRNRL